MSLTILIVEDSEAKLSSIQALLEREIPGVSIRTACSVRSAIDDLVNFTPDVIIADMSLPTFDIEVGERGGTPRPFGGIEVFETLERNEVVIPVIVVTSYPLITDGHESLGLKDLSKRLASDFPETFEGTVYFDSAYSDWETEITQLINKVRTKFHGA
ncbi:response regulator [Paraburkholderia sp. J67]|uniref:response regulator n=1 Tax=Paraburkholderia sp. J67 TaxID=2805435 RepID=UPI002ABE10A9|nr:response regulator [Paraburkholderia sp. J67]